MSTVGRISFDVGYDAAKLRQLVSQSGNQIRGSLNKSFDSARTSARGLNDEVSKMAKTGSSAFSKMSAGAVALGSIIAQVVLAAIRKIGQYMGDAISRLDTLNNFPRVMASMGVSAEESSKVINYLSDKLIGLPTALDTAASGVKRFTAVNKNIGASTEMFLALNNAVLAGGESQDIQATAIEQMTQSYAKGKPDMMEWRSMLVAMPNQLEQIAKHMGMASAEQLRQSLVGGTASMNDMMLAMIDLNKNGGNGIQSFAEQAKGATGGVGTSMANLRTAFVRGLANIMNAIGQANIAAFFGWISAAVSKAMSWVASFTSTVMRAVAWLGKLFGFTVKLGDSGGGVASAGAGAGEAAAGFDDMADAADSAGGAAGGAGKAAKKAADQAKKALMGFDKINKLPDKSDSSSGGGGGGGGGAGAPDMGGLGNFEIPDTSKVADALKGLNDRAKELFQTFKDGFKAGLGTDFIDSIQRMKSHVSSLGYQMQLLFTSSEVQGSISNWVDKVTYAFGQISGSAISVGATLGEFLLGSLDNYVSENAPFIKDRIVGIFDAFGNIAQTAGNYAEAVANIFEVFRSESAKSIGGDIIGVFANTFLSIQELAGTFLDDLTSSLYEPFVASQEKIKGALQEVLDTLAPLFDQLKNWWDEILLTILNAYNKYISPAFENVKTAVQAIINGWLEMWAVIKPKLDEFISDLLERLGPTIEFIKDAIEIAFEVIGKVISAAADIIQGLVDFVVGAFTGDWERAWEGIKKIFTGLWDAIAGVLDGIVDVIVSLVENGVESIRMWVTDKFEKLQAKVKEIWDKIKNSITGVWTSIKTAWSNVGTWFSDKFTAAWKSITSAFSTAKTWALGRWQAIKDVFANPGAWFKTKFSDAWTKIKSVFSGVGSFFGGIWTTIKKKFTNIGQKIGSSMSGAFKGAINSVIRVAESTINKAVNLINSAIRLINKLPGVSVSTVPRISIPRLAQGGYVDANTPQLAIIGDNKREGEIVAPESKLRAMALDAARSVAGSGDGGGLRELTVPVYLDGKEIARVLLGERELKNVRSGGHGFA